MEAGEKRLSRVDRKHQRELFKTEAELYRLREKNQLLRGTEEKLFLAEKNSKRAKINLLLTSALPEVRLTTIRCKQSIKFYIPLLILYCVG